MSKLIHLMRIEGLLTIKARRSKTEVQLVARMQRIFDKAQRRMITRLKQQGSTGMLARRIVLNELDIIYDEMGNLIYESALVQAADAPIAETLLRQQSFTASRLTMDRVRGNVEATLADAWKAGLGTTETADLLEEQFEGMTKSEVQRVARTEVNAAQSNSRHAKMKGAGVKYSQWWSRLDKRVRDSHEEIHGLITRIDDRFPNGLKHPHDRSGALKEWINCRCRELPFLMPANMAPPPGKIAFRESELIRLAA